MKRQSSECEKIFANEAINKGLISKIQKQFMHLTIKKKQRTQSKNGQIYNKQTFLQRRYTDGQKAHENMLKITNFREMQIKTIMGYHLTPVRMAIIKESLNNKYQGGCGGKGTLLHCWWECKLVQPLWRTVWRFLKKLKQNYHMTQQSHPWHISGEKHNSKRYKQPNVHCSTIYNSQNIEAA